MQWAGLDTPDSGGRRQRSYEVLAEVGLKGLEDRLPAQLSGGQQQRVAVTALVCASRSLRRTRYRSYWIPTGIW